MKQYILKSIKCPILYREASIKLFPILKHCSLWSVYGNIFAPPESTLTYKFFSDSNYCENYPINEEKVKIIFRIKFSKTKWIDL
jgi:hypothetical protein